jgi:hypothetical protein
MAFPLTHLLVAHGLSCEPAFLLGSISPDAVHYRRGYVGAQMSGIGEEKKATHYCHPTPQRWGRVTDNDAWLANALAQLAPYMHEPFAAGYAAHIITDIHNNSTLWRGFVTNYPEEAAKGYKSEYYADLQAIDMHLYLTHPAVPQIMAALAKAQPPKLWEGAPVSQEEIAAIQDNILHEHFKNAREIKRTYQYVTPQAMLEYIATATARCAALTATPPAAQ